MRALVTEGRGLAQVRDWPAPVASGDEIVVAPLLVGMCGTDLELIDGTIDPAYVRYPLVLGHEWVGALDEDDAVFGPAGTRVVAEGVVPCGVCDACRRGATNLCVTYDEVGFTRAGAAAALVGVPRRLVHPLGDDVAVDDAVLVEPMAVVWRALTRFPLRQGLSVAVVGDGTIALLAVHLVRLLAPETVTMIGRRGEQRALAFDAGADTFVTTPPDERFDLVIEAAGTPDAVLSALRLAARGAMVIVLGLSPHGSRVDVAPDELVNDDLVVQGSFSYTRESFSDVVRRLNRGELHPSFLLTHRAPLEDALRAVATLRGEGVTGPRGKVVLDLGAR